MAYLKNWTDNFFQMFFMGTSWVAVSINNIKTRASREMTSRKNIKIFYFNGVNVAKHWHVAWARYLPSLIAPMYTDLGRPGDYICGCGRPSNLVMFGSLWTICQQAVITCVWEEPCLGFFLGLILYYR